METFGVIYILSTIMGFIMGFIGGIVCILAYMSRRGK